MDSLDVDVRWRNLLDWLANHHDMDTSDYALLVERRMAQGAGYGLYAKKAIDPSTKLFQVPASALLNKNTLPKLQSLSATQAISLHLFLHQPSEGGDSSDPLFGPYISTLPRDFGYHPLSCRIFDENSARILPPSAARALLNLESRFRSDLAVVCSFVQTRPELLEGSVKTLADFTATNKSLVPDYLWAWLNVNTRCVYYQVKSSSADPENITLCPILDFANHTSHLPHMNPPSPDKGFRRQRGHFALMSPADASVPANAELYLTYGSHCNRVLFVEYGFVLSPDSIPPDQRTFEVQVDDLVENLFASKCNAGVLMKETLELEGYWGDWTMHLTAGSAYPSYRLITALRLYSVLSPRAALTEEVLRPWRETIEGRRMELDPEYEEEVRKVLRTVCQVIVERVARALAGPKVKAREEIVLLWDEERVVAQNMIDRIDNGEDFA